MGLFGKREKQFEMLGGTKVVVIGGEVSGKLGGEWVKVRIVEQGHEWRGKVLENVRKEWITASNIEIDEELRRLSKT